MDADVSAVLIAFVAAAIIGFIFVVSLARHNAREHRRNQAFKARLNTVNHPRPRKDSR